MQGLKRIGYLFALIAGAGIAGNVIEAQCAKCISSQCQWGPLNPPAYAGCIVIGGVCYNDQQSCGKTDEAFEFTSVDFGLDGTGMIDTARSKIVSDRLNSTRRVSVHCSGIVNGAV